MRVFILLAGITAGVMGMSLRAEAACNVRGEYCDYPGCAANAFTHPFDRVPDAWLNHPNSPYSYGYVARGHTNKKRYRKHYRLGHLVARGSNRRCHRGRRMGV